MNIQQLVGIIHQLTTQKAQTVQEGDAKVERAWKLLEQNIDPEGVKYVVKLLGSSSQEIRERAEHMLGPWLGEPVGLEEKYSSIYSDFTRELFLACQPVLANIEEEPDFRQRCARILIDRYLGVKYDQMAGDQKAKNVLRGTGLNKDFIKNLTRDRDPEIREMIKNRDSVYTNIYFGRVFQEMDYYLQDREVQSLP